MKENEKIKKVRTTLKLTQQELADALDVSKQYISSVERGCTDLSKDKVILFCNKYDISADWLLRNRGRMHYKAACASNSVSEQTENKIAKPVPQKHGEVVKPIPASAAKTEDFLPCIGLFSSYIKTSFSVIDENGLNAKTDDKLMVAASLFYKDLMIKNIPITEADNLLEEFETRIKDSEDFKDRILNEYYNSYLENNNKR